MKRQPVAFVLIAAVLGLGLHGSVAAQDAPQPSVYAMIDYMKVAEGKEQDYERVEKQVWKKIHQQRLEDKLITGWYFFKLDNPPEESRDYQYVTVNIFPSFAKLEEPYPDKYFSALAEEELEKQMQATADARELLRSEVYKLEAAVFSEEQPENPFILVNYMQASKGNEAKYVRAETQVWQKLHKARVDARAMQAWLFMSRRFPAGSEVPYGFITIDGYTGRAQAEQSFDLSILAAVAESFDDDQGLLLDGTEQLRTVVKQDVWKRLDFVSDQE